ncbi:hypothetical protein [Kitasatospora sp. NPDC050543]|uniref:hypothetical protein n=1 Tax=Kitasatospora sp. NPDC050543 TaxID=3364054 RepID=UPI0037AACA4F
MSTRYLPTGETDPDVFDTSDYTRDGWKFTALSDLMPGPIAMVTVAVTDDQDPQRQQCDVQLLLDPASGCSMRVRGRHHLAHYATETDEEPVVVARNADLEGVDSLRISLYGACSRLGLAAALREAAEMLESADQMPDGT